MAHFLLISNTFSPVLTASSIMARFMSSALLSVTTVTCFPNDSSIVAMAMAPGGPSVSSGGLKGKHQQQSIILWDWYKLRVMCDTASCFSR